MTKSNNEWVPEIASYERIDSEKLSNAIRLLDGEKLISRSAFRWMENGHVISNAYESFDLEQVCEDNNWQIVCQYGDSIAVVRPIVTKTEAEKRLGIQIEDMTDVIFGHLRSDLTADGSRKLAGDIIDAGWIKPKPLTAYVIEELADEFYHDKYAFAKAIEAYIRGEG